MGESFVTPEERKTQIASIRADVTGMYLNTRGGFPLLKLTADGLSKLATPQPEYAAFRSTFAGFPLMRLVADAMFRAAGLVAGDAKTVRQFPKPSRFATQLVQSMWIPFGLRFNCFTISGIKR